MLGVKAAPDEQVSFGKYLLLAKLATGGMGEVFLAQLRAAGGFEKLVVIKRILPHLTDKPEFVQMFVNEARTAAQITHPNVCQIYELGQVDDRYYMAMEYLEGVPFAEVMVAARRLPALADLRFLVPLLSQVCEGLYHAHSLRGPGGRHLELVHRDVNPRNIFVTSAGVAKVLDFGIAKAQGAVSHTAEGAVKGTYSYMSPEQLAGHDLDSRSDVFSLGIVAWEAVVGRRLFKRKSDMLTWKAITEEDIPRASQYRDDVPAEVDEVIARALERDVSRRFPSTRELGVALEKAIRPLGAPCTTLSIANEVEKAFITELAEQRERVFSAHRENAETKPVSMTSRPNRWDEDSKSETEVEEGLTSADRPSRLGRQGTPRPETIGAGRPLPLPGVAAAAPIAPPRVDSSVDHLFDDSGGVLVAAARRAATPIPVENSRRPLHLILGLAAIAGALGLAYHYKRGRSDEANHPPAAAEAIARAPAPAPAEIPTSDHGRSSAETQAGTIDPAPRPIPTSEGDHAATDHAATDHAATDHAVTDHAATDHAATDHAGHGDGGASHTHSSHRLSASDEDPTGGKPGSHNSKVVAEVARPGFLTLNAQPYATVYVDGKQRGVTPIVHLQLAAGPHALRLVSADGEKKLKIVIDPGDETRKLVKW